MKNFKNVLKSARNTLGAALFAFSAQANNTNIQLNKIIDDAIQAGLSDDAIIQTVQSNNQTQTKARNSDIIFVNDFEYVNMPPNLTNIIDTIGGIGLLEPGVDVGISGNIIDENVSTVSWDLTIIDYPENMGGQQDTRVISGIGQFPGYLYEIGTQQFGTVTMTFYAIDELGAEQTKVIYDNVEL